MKMLKNLILVVGLITLCLAAHCQPVKKIEAIRFHTPAVQLSLVPAQYLSWQALQATKSTVGKTDLLEGSAKGRRIRGLALEKPALEAYKEFAGGKSIKWVKASYNGKTNGIDGLALKFNKRGTLTDVHVIEVKSGNAHLGKTQHGMQLSKEWILHSLDKSIVQKTKEAAKWKKEMEKYKGKTSKRAQKKFEKAKKKFEDLNKAKRNLKKARKYVEKDQYKAYEVRINYKDGRLVITQRRATEDANGKIKLGKTTKLVDFSYLEKDIKTLKPGQLKYRKSLLKNLRKYLEDSGAFTENEINTYMNLLETGKVQEVEKAIKYRINTQKIMTTSIGAGFILWSAGSEIKAIYDYVHGKMTKADFVFDTITNGLGVATGTFGIVATWAELGATAGSVMQISNVFMVAGLTAIDVIRNIYNISHGNIRTSEGVINIVAGVAGTAAAILGAKAGAWLGLQAGSAIGTAIGGPVGMGAGGAIGGAIGGVAGGIGGYLLASKGVSYIGHLALAKYESYKEPARFHDYCGAIRQHYALAS